jgi:hypothetical protein
VREGQGSEALCYRALHILCRRRQIAGRHQPKGLQWDHQSGGVCCVQCALLLLSRPSGDLGTRASNCTPAGKRKRRAPSQQEGIESIRNLQQISTLLSGINVIRIASESYCVPWATHITRGKNACCVRVIEKVSCWLDIVSLVSRQY